jgi:hypothetical protein
MPALEQQIGRCGDAAARRADDRGVIARPELDAGTMAQTSGDPRDEPELAEFTDGDDPPPTKTGYGGRLTAVPGRT